MMAPPAFSSAWLREAIAEPPKEEVRVLGHGLWGPTLDLGDGTVLKLVRRRAGIGDGLDICGNEARVLAALGGRPLGSVAVPRLVARGEFAAESEAAAAGFAAWLRMTRVAGRSIGDDWLASRSELESERFAASYGHALAALRGVGTDRIGSTAGLDERLRALLIALPAVSPRASDGDLCAALLAELEAMPPGRRAGFVHGDAHLENLLVDDAGRVCGVIDFGEAGRGFPEIDLAYLHWLPTIAAAVRHHYGEAAGPLDERSFHVAGAIYALTAAVISERHGDGGEAAGDRRLLAACLDASGLGRGPKAGAR